MAEKLLRYEDELADEVKSLAKKQKKSENQVIQDAIQCAVQNMILGNSLDISMADFHEYQVKAKSFLKQKNRPLRLDDILW